MWTKGIFDVDTPTIFFASQLNIDIIRLTINDSSC